MVAGARNYSIPWTIVAFAGYTLTMSDSIPAIFDSGVFRPLEPVDLADGTRADVIPHHAAPQSLSVWPSGYFEQTAGAFRDELIERPPQGSLSQRESW
jgi:hypothetical protein